MTYFIAWTCLGFLITFVQRYLKIYKFGLESIIEYLGNTPCNRSKNQFDLFNLCCLRQYETDLKKTYRTNSFWRYTEIVYSLIRNEFKSYQSLLVYKKRKLIQPLRQLMKSFLLILFHAICTEIEFLTSNRLIRLIRVS